MFHLFGKVYLEDIALFKQEDDLKGSQFVVFDSDKHSILSHFHNRGDFMDHYDLTIQDFWTQISKTQEKKIFYVDQMTFFSMQIEFWNMILKSPTRENLYWLHSTYLQDMRIKSTSESHTIEGLEYIRSCRPLDESFFHEIVREAKKPNLDDPRNLKNVGIEYLLATYFESDGLRYQEYFFPKIDHLSWKQIVQEFFVIRNQLVNALYNNINLALPAEHKIDYSLDVEAQMFGNPYLSWMCDPDFREDNTQYIKENYNINQLAELYDNWIKYRRPKERTPELELELDNLTWITQAIVDENWQHLFEKNLERDFGCIYVDNWLIHKANQIWTGSLYREANHSHEKTLCRRLALK